MGFYSYFLLGEILGVEWEDIENKLISISFVGLTLKTYVQKKYSNHAQFSRKVHQ